MRATFGEPGIRPFRGLRTDQDERFSKQFSKKHVST
jgi:hypothetical protein